MDVLEAALRPAPASRFDSLEAFWSQHLEQIRTTALPVDRAILGGVLADRLGYAFVAGYTAALQALFPDLPVETLASLAATEEGGAHPRAIQTRLTREGDGWKLEGQKRWVTLGGEELFVLARKGENTEGRAELVVVRLSRSATGVTLHPQPPSSFVPEISHAAISFENVLVTDDQLLPGDGWARWVKPFRTVEDLHVHAALLGHLTAVASRVNWPHEVRERLAALLITFRALTQENPSSAAVHLAVAGAIAEARGLIGELDWSAASSEERERWERDRRILEVAGGARLARTKRAWERFS